MSSSRRLLKDRLGSPSDDLPTLAGFPRAGACGNVLTVSTRSRNPTIHEVARRAGVSTATVGRALGNYGRIKESTRLAVLDAAAALGYRPNELARSMITGRTNTFGVVCADIHSPFFSGIVRGITDSARDSGYSVLITNSDERYEAEREALGLLLEKQVDGVIVSPADVRRVEHLLQASEQGKPVVMVDRTSSMFRTDAVLIDGPGVTQEAVERLFRLGHRRIAIVAELRAPHEADWQTAFAGDVDAVDGFSLNPSSARLLGYLRAHKEYGVPVDPSLVFQSGEYSAESATRATLAGLDRSERPTAVFCTDNTMSLGAYRAIRQLGLDIPGEISFVGFDNLEWTELVEPGISVIDQPVYEMGRQAAQMLIGRLHGEQGGPQRITLPARFLDRRSVAAPPAAS
jgi:LacI family transcriptional regulator